MSDCDRLDRITLGIIIVPLILILLSALYDRSQEPYRAYQTAQKEYYETEKFAISSGMSESEIADVYSAREDWRGEQDLEAQWQVAKWTAIAVYVGAVGTTAAIIGVVLLYFTWRETENVTEQTRRIGITQSQAYLVVTEIGLELARPDVMVIAKGEEIVNEFYFFFWLKIKNYGQSPAYDISGTLNIGWQPLIQFGDTGQINRLSAGKDMRAGFGYSGVIAPQATSKIETWGMIPVAAEKLMNDRAGPNKIIGYMPRVFGDIEWINEFKKRQTAVVTVPGSARLAPLKATDNSVAPIIIQQA